MKLRYSPTSPFVRKTMVVAIEAGVRERIELVSTNPWDPASDITRDNPAGKVPALVTDEGETLYDSRVICEYLDADGGARLYPPAGPERWRALKRQALGDGILDACVLRFIERQRRPAELGWAAWLDRQKGKIDRSLDLLEGEAGDFGDLDIGLVTVGCALGYLDFRFAEEDWRPGREALAGWYAELSKRPSFADTVLSEPA
jgi:glutathione S-transferase